MAKNENDKRLDMLVRVARMYYEQDLSQEEIAVEMQCSRPYVSRLLTDAKKMGIVQFKIVPPLGSEAELERELRAISGLEKVIVVPEKSNVSKLEGVGRRAIEYLESIVRCGDTIGVSWGNTLHSITELLPQRTDLEDITTVQMCGGISDLQNNIYSLEIARNFARYWNAKSYALVSPALVDSREIRDVFISDSNISKVLECGKKANIMLITMGSYGLQNAVYRAGYLTEAEMQRLTEAGAVGDVCGHIINQDGELCDLELDGRTVAVPLEDMKSKKHRIGVAIGQHKVECICAAIRGGIINVLVTDEETAERVVERMS